jgi:hypothetical protein
MKTRLPLLVVFLAVCGSVAIAHGNKVHVRGTVEKTSADSLQVKTPQGKIVEVKLGAATVYLLHTADADKPAKLSDLAAGDLVVIHATPKGDSLEAEEVKFSEPHTNKMVSPATPKPKP